MLRHAATVVVLRPTGRADEHAGQVEVLLMRRTSNSRFMGGATVFPGGTLDDADFDLPSPLPAKCLARFGALEGGLADAKLVGALHVAAVRELFEEAGVLLAHGAAGSGSEWSTCSAQSALVNAREALCKGELPFSQALQQLGVEPAFSHLTYMAHWVTPEVEPRRFDTRFFAAWLPPGQQPSVDGHEATTLRWLTPNDALSLHHNGEIVLPPPTLHNLWALHVAIGMGALEQALAPASVPTILPEISHFDDQLAVVLPWDSAYGQRPHGLLAPVLADGRTAASRVVLDGVWRLRS